MNHMQHFATWEYYLDATSTEHAHRYEILRPLGWRIRSLDMYGDPQAPRFAAVWVKTNLGPDGWKATPGLVSSSQLGAHIKGHTAQGFRPSIIAAAGVDGLGAVVHDAVFSLVFDSTPGFLPGARRVRANMSETELWAEVATAQTTSERVRWLAASTSTGQAPVFHAVLEQHGVLQFRPWSVQRSWGKAELGRLAAGMAAGWTRPDCLALIDPQTHWTVWRDDVWAEAPSSIGVSKAFIPSEMGAVEFEEMTEILITGGYYPIRISACGGQWRSDPVRFAAIFMWNAKDDAAFPSEKKAGRTWRAEPLVPLFSSDPFSPVDKYIKSLMVHYGIRGGQVAIARKGQLKTVRAYTYAESDYPDTTVMQTVRVGSISKAITGTAVTRLDETLPYDLETTKAQAVLGSTQLLARTPTPANAFLNGTAPNPLLVRHLLTHTGGWQTYPSDPKRAVDWETDTFKTYEALKSVPPGQLAAKYETMSRFPLNPALVEATVAGMSSCIVNTPGTKNAYSGYAVFLLANILVRIAKPFAAYTSRNYSDVVADLLWKPLNVQRAHLPVPENQDPADASEMRMHPAFPTAAPDMNFDYSQGSKRWLFSPNNFNPALTGPPGGWHMTAAGLVKLLASFDPNFANPVLSPTSIQRFYSSSIANGQSNLWFNAQGSTGSANYNVIEHNGATPGSSSFCCHCSDGISIVVLFNMDIPASPGPSTPKFILSFGYEAGYLGFDLRKILDTIPPGDWPADDLFTFDF